MSTPRCSCFQTAIPEALQRFWNRIHFIAPHLGVDYPFSPFLKYKYPPASDQIVKNIAKALLQYPDFYYQVLHIMNKMNLTPPFFTTDTEELNNGGLSDASDEEMSPINNACSPSSKPVVVSTDMKKLKGSKVKKLSNILPSKDINRRTPHKIEDAFENIPLPKRPMITISAEKKTINEICQNGVADKIDETRGFGKMDKIPTSQTDTDSFKWEDLNDINVLTKEDLVAGLLPVQEWPNHKALKTYSIGDPCSRLYLKNLDKSVSEDDLNRIFFRYVDSKNETHRNA